MSEHSAPVISVVIPTFNEARALPATLDQFARLPGSWQIIVADSGSADGTPEIAERAGVALVADAPAGRGVAMNAGARRAIGEFILFLHADTRLPENAYALITGALRQPEVAATGFRLRMDRRDWRYRLLSPIATARFRIQRTFFGDQAIAVRRADFEQLGGYHEPLLMEDVELSRRLRRLGRLELLPAQVTTSARRFEQGGVVRTLARMATFQVAYGLGVSAERIARHYGHGRVDGASSADALQIETANLMLWSLDGEPVRVGDLADQRPVLLVFLRWLG